MSSSLPVGLEACYSSADDVPAQISTTWMWRGGGCKRYGLVLRRGVAFVRLRWELRKSPEA